MAGSTVELTDEMSGAARLRWDEREGEIAGSLGDGHFARGGAPEARPRMERDAPGGAPDLAPQDGPAVIGLGVLNGTNGFRIDGIAEDNEVRSGYSVAGAGDVNGDGFDDIIIGAPGVDQDAGGGYTRFRVGESYVVFGKADGFAASIALASLDGVNGFRLTGGGFGNAGDESGFSVSSAGDFNGDGFDDLIIGAPQDDFSGDFGKTYIVFGKASGFAASTELATLTASAGFRIGGIGDEDNLGFSVSSAGDVNGDGFDDVIVGAVNAAPGGDEEAGQSFVIFGKASGFGTSFDLSSLDGANGFRIDGIDALDNAGQSVSSAGDVNGDGFDDIIIGAPNADPGGRSGAGESYLVFGKASGFAASIDLASLDGTNGFRIDAIDASDYGGSSVSDAGDVNGDGFDDIIVGAFRADPGGDSSAGESYVVFGKAGGFTASLALSSLDGTNGFRIDGVNVTDLAGSSVSSAGDFNGDGFDDIVIGARGGDVGDETNAGKVYVVYGKASGFGASIDLASLDGGNGFRLEGIEAFDNAGRSVSSAGDVNGDGFDDLVIGAPNANDYTGASYIVFGFADGAATIAGSSGADSLIGGADDEVLQGLEGDDTLQGNGGGDTLEGGAGLDWADYTSAAGNIRADLQSPAANTGDAAGDSYVGIENLRGGARRDALSGDGLANRIEGMALNDTLAGRGGNDTLAGGAGRDSLTGGNGADRFLLASALAADADTITDFAPGADKIVLDSEIFQLRAGALDATRFVVGNQAADANDRLIYKASTGELFFDADGTGASAQLLIATLANLPALAAGDFIVELAPPEPLIIDLALLDGADGFRVIGLDQGDRSGLSVASAGDVNGDGFDDIVIGADGGDPDGVDRAGETYVIFGKASGFPANFNPATLNGATGFRIEGENEDDQTGYSVASAGDINGDGFDDIVIGAEYALGAAYESGKSFVVFGKAGGFGASVNLGSLDGANGFGIDGLAIFDGLGAAVSGAGDVNGDGIDDLAISGEYDFDGVVYVIFGKTGPFDASFDLAGLDGGDGFRIEGSQDIGGALSAGDVNGDGIDDLVIGGDDRAYVVFGSDDPFGATFDLASLDGANGFMFYGGFFTGTGGSVSSGGDINGDGFDDVIIGAGRADADGEQYAGVSYVVFGRAGGFAAQINPAALDGTNGFRLDGNNTQDRAGNVASIGDFNGDGFDDLLVGASGVDGETGQSYIVFGQAEGFAASIDLDSLDETTGIRLDGVDPGDISGVSVSGAGDVNGDGFDDIIIGAPYADRGASISAGESYVVFGFRPRAIMGDAGANLLSGGGLDDALFGLRGDDTLRGGEGADELDGGAGTDFADYTDATVKVVADLKAPQLNTGDAAGDEYIDIENLRGSGFKDRLSGDDAANRLEGLAKEDVLSGRKGDDTLAGGAGRDQLKGGAGEDRFELSSIDGDRIFDFASGVDEIALDGAVFGLPVGALAAGRFVIGNQALDANDRLIYKADSGKLFFDPDGNGAAAQVQIATLSGAPTIDATDFIVI